MKVFESLSINMHDKTMRTGIKKGCEYPTLVFADKEKIRMVLLNLVRMLPNTENKMAVLQRAYIKPMADMCWWK
ncbi:MAG: hypothetical protein WDM78_10080 [Puia sp.]